jgi:hypothetical protein
MLNFKSFMIEEETLITEQYLSEQYDILMEKMITFGGKTSPKYGNVVILAGGMASGKGFVKSNLIGVDGYSFDPDALKPLVASAPILVAKIKKKFGRNVPELAKNMNPKNATILHNLIGKELKIGDRRLEALYKSVTTAPQDRKPNIIFDFSLQKFDKLDKTIDAIIPLGYDKSNIHIVWVVNDVEVASAQNQARSRTAPEDLLRASHAGASLSMQKLVSMGEGIGRYLDGEIVIAFNKVKVDNELATGIKVKDKKLKGKVQGANMPVQTKRGLKKVGAGSTGQYLKDAEYVYLKRKGKKVTSVKNLATDIVRKIKSYVPNPEIWK